MRSTSTSSRSNAPRASEKLNRGRDVSRPVFPTVANVIADDGDAVRFCSTCAFSQACIAEGMDKGALRDLHVLVEHVGNCSPERTCFAKATPSMQLLQYVAARSRRAGSIAKGVNRSLDSTFPARSLA